MPTYEYRCSNCGAEIEVFQKMSDAPVTHCEKCGNETLKRIVSGGAGVIYKGEGWYVTDYSKKSSGGKEMTDKPKTDDKPTSKPGTATPATEPAKPAEPKAKPSPKSE